ncbi:phosphoribosyltransferase [Aureibaculum marinum]|uniref:Phosphoribosyltransferase n=1 Tax=Aureibaculum marinum TaxID=2487930 RepID=A0A3N4P0X4_9FLAO|nr:phosphoribosyltransferase family protein [Aureibaculum marinum]RPD93033.1 phosphoribosyltransferase [Aureibaculum marinum]
MKRSIILNNTEIQHKIRRMAFQIYETNANQKEVIIAGIAKNGFVIAQELKSIVEEISPLKATVCEVIIDKKNPLNAIETSLDKNEYKNKSLVLVDDVLNSGTTLMYAVKHFLEVPLKQFKTAVLVNRNHKKYPIKADFKGLSLSTSIQEHIALEIKGSKMVAYLD